jgi:hypothetical protein
MAIGGFTAAIKYYNTRKTTSGPLAGVTSGQVVLLGGQGGAGAGNDLTPDNDNGLWVVNDAGAWTKLEWVATSVPKPHIQVGGAGGDGGDQLAGFYTMSKRTNGVLILRL